MKQSTVFIIGMVVGVLLTTSINYQIEHCRKADISEIKRDTVIDTIQYYMPVPVDSVVIRYVEEKVPVSQTVIDTIQVTAGDSVAVDIPITQKEYSDSTYHAWVSGFRVALDSIHVYRPTTTITYMNTSQQKPKRWGLGVQVGVAMTQAKVQPYIGVGVSYNLLNW